jgi:hypothetical protein
MIYYILKWLREQCVLSGVDIAYQDYMPDEVLNICAVRTTTGSIGTKTLNGTTSYNNQVFDILYRGGKQRGDSIKLMSDIYDSVDNVYNLSLINTRIITTNASQPLYAFTDDNGNSHYSITIEINYEKV